MDKSKADQRILVTSRVLWRITWKSLSTVSPVLWKSLVALLQEKRLGKSSWAMCSETVFEPRHFQAAREMGRGNFCIKGTWDFRLKLESNPENRPFWAWLRIYFTTRRDYTQDRQPIDARTNWEIWWFELGDVFWNWTVSPTLYDGVWFCFNIYCFLTPP